MLSAAATAAGAAAHAAREQEWAYGLYQTVSYKKYGCCDGDRGTEALMAACGDACEEDVESLTNPLPYKTSIYLLAVAYLRAIRAISHMT